MKLLELAGSVIVLGVMVTLFSLSGGGDATSADTVYLIGHHQTAPSQVVTTSANIARDRFGNTGNMEVLHDTADGLVVIDAYGDRDVAQAFIDANDLHDDAALYELVDAHNPCSGTASVLIEHDAPDFESWYDVFSTTAPTSATGYRIFRHLDDPAQVIVMFDFATPEDAQSYSRSQRNLSAPVLRVAD